MKIAIPVKDESLTFFANAGHTPKFAIYEMVGEGMFRSFKLEDVIPNPRTDIDHDESKENHHCKHDHNDAEHIAQHDKMGTALSGCCYLVAKKACKNTINSMKSNGIDVIKYSGNGLKSEDILKEIVSSFS